MKSKKLLIFISFFVTLNIASTVYADDLTKRVGFGFGNPYISIKLGLSPKCSIEGRGAFGSGIKVRGGRFYYNFNPQDKAVIYTGGEYSQISFDTKNISGDGSLKYLFVGGEYFITSHLTFNLDIGPIYLSLKEEKTNISSKESAWLYN
ncbi:MAG: hypothetical protein AB1567_13060 [bacterium]